MKTFRYVLNYQMPVKENITTELLALPVFEIVSRNGPAGPKSDVLPFLNWRLGAEPNPEIVSCRAVRAFVRARGLVA